MRRVLIAVSIINFVLDRVLGGGRVIGLILNGSTGRVLAERFR